MSPALQDARDKLEKARTEDKLTHHLQSRPEKGDLQNRNILDESDLAPSLIAVRLLPNRLLNGAAHTSSRTRNHSACETMRARRVFLSVRAACVIARAYVVLCERELYYSRVCINLEVEK